MPETVWHLRHALTGGLTETRVEHAHQGAHWRQQSRCPQCARRLPARDPVRRTVATLLGAVQLERPSCSCPACPRGLSPLDEVWGLSPGRTHLDVQKAAVQLVTDVPDDEAQTLCGDVTGLGVGSERMQTCPNHVAAGRSVVDVAPARDEIERRIAEVAAGRLRRPVLVLGIDGASVPTRPERARGRRPGPGRQRARRARWQGQGRDAKGLRFSLRDGERIVPVRSGHQVQTEAQLGAALTPITEAGVMPAEQVRLGVVWDGAAWIWQHVQALCPQARQVRDDDHCAQDRHRVAQAHDGASGQAVEWVEATMTRLSLGTVGRVLGGWQRMPAQSDEAPKAMAHCWDSLSEHRGHPHERHLRRGGSPLGSGGIASSHKCIGHVRLKRSGAWWYEVHSHHLFALRCAKDNGTLDQVLERYQQQQRGA